ncbi:sulfotransferase family 2 domain-containing protein [Marinobacter xestospongiae]|uniref:Sulfotransferase family 2 domain-containing protein n=1 Tax=Marinobacter xestospongiae TaxID=994319 RepID=A0ABU3W119_9GAMM|nr:sulfotransferase family 2 domain-containing protein [Marinobacter xestospongiae]MDV2080242.1 sulfotransferase family 2 domain-containing protein [Marinobacter xestospongiae]
MTDRILKLKLQLKHWLRYRYHRRLRNSFRNQPFNERDMLFVHVPKAAGTAVIESLFGRSAGMGHTTAKKYLQIFGGAHFYSKYRFTFVRNPYDRLVSAYEYLCRGGNNSYDLMFKQRTMDRFSDFDDFVLNGLRHDPAVQNHVHFRRQTDFLYIGSSLAVDFVGRYENLDKDFSYLASIAGVSAALEQKNPSQRSRTVSDYYQNPEVRQAVREFYQSDFQALQYDDAAL